MVNSCPRFQQVVESEQRVSLAAAKRCAQLNDRVPRATAEHFKYIRKQSAKVPSRIGGPEELACVAVDLRDVGVAAVDATKISGVRRHLQVAGHDIVVRADDLIPRF